LGSIYDKRGDKNNALVAFVKAQPYLQKAKDTLREKIVLLRISTIYTDQQKPEKALSYDERAAELFKEIGDRKAEAQALYGVAVDLASLRRFRQAIEAGDQAATIWRELNQVKDLGGCLLLTGRLWLNLGDERFLKDLKEAVRYSKTINDFKTEAEALANLGLASTLADQATEAIEDFRQALSLAAGSGDLKLRGTILSDLGLNYMLQGDRQTAIEYLLEAQQLQHSSSDRKGEANTLNDLGLLYAQLGDDEQGLTDFQQALTLFQELKDTNLEAYALNSIGTLHLTLKHNEEATEFFNQAAKLEKSLDKLDDITLITEENLAFALDLTGEHTAAQKRYRDLLTVLHDAGNRRVEATVSGNLAISYIRTGDYEEARAALQQSLSLRTAIPDHDGLIQSLSGLAELERTIGNLDAARSLIEKALDQADWLRNKVTQGDLRASYSAGLQSLNEFQITLLMQLHDLRPSQGFDRLAFEANERGRARTLVELLREARVDFHQGADAASLERLTELQHELSAKEQFYSSLALGSGSDEALQQLRTDITQLTSESLVAEDGIRRKSPQYAALTGSAPITLLDVQKRLLDRDTVLLEFALGEKTSFLWIVSETDIRTFQLPARDQIERLARRAYRDLTAKAAIYEDKSGPSFELTKLLFGDAAPLLLRKRLLIVPDGALNYIPFAALPDPADLGQLADDDPKPMVLSHEIICLPSASALMALRGQIAGRSPAAKAMMVFADPVFDKTDSRVKSATTRTSPQLTFSGGLEVKLRGTLREFAVTTGSTQASLPRLEGTRAEALKIAELLPPDLVRLRLDFEASRDAAFSPDLANYRYVHFATHGVFDSDHPALSALALSLVNPDGTAQDSFLHTADIFNLKLQAELTTLSGCETGLGKELRGEGVLGLTRGCLYAGSQRVLVSLWKISDQATANLMTNLYSKILKNGETPAAALRAAQITMLNDPETKAPFYWAAFVLEGEWR
jgi:CHAT domain-containing protein